MSRYIPLLPGDSGFRDPTITKSPMLTNNAGTDGAISNQNSKLMHSENKGTDQKSVQKFDNAIEGDASESIDGPGTPVTASDGTIVTAGDGSAVTAGAPTGAFSAQGGGNPPSNMGGSLGGKTGGGFDYKKLGSGSGNFG